MNVEQMKKEIENLGISPAAEKMYPITSDWVPISDVLAIVDLRNIGRVTKRLRASLKVV
jgi:hypothetical protein